MGGVISSSECGERSSPSIKSGVIGGDGRERDRSSRRSWLRLARPAPPSSATAQEGGARGEFAATAPIFESASKPSS